MCVCLFAMHSYTVQPISMKLSRNDLYTQGEVDIYLVRKKTNPTHATGNLWNWPIGFQHLKKWKETVAKAAEGRLSAHTRHLTCFVCPWQPVGCYGQPGKLTNGIAPYEKVTENASKRARRPSERLYTRPYMFYVSMANVWLLRTTEKIDQ